MVYVPTPRNAKNEQEIYVVNNSSPRQKQAPVGTPVSAKDVLQFALELCGVPSVHAVLAKAHEVGLTGDDLQILDEQDVEMLLPSSRLHQRKFLRICKFLQDGGVLRYGMSMATIYSGPGDWEGVVNIEAESKVTKSSIGSSQAQSRPTPSSNANRPSSFVGGSNANTGYSNTLSSNNAHAVSSASVATVPTANNSNTYASASQNTNLHTSHGDGGCGCGWMTNLTTGASNFMAGIQNQMKQIQKLQTQFGQLMTMCEKLKG